MSLNLIKIYDVCRDENSLIDQLQSSVNWRLGLTILWLIGASFVER